MTFGHRASGGRRRFCGFVRAALAAAAVSLTAGAVAAAGAGEDWTTPSGTLEGTRYSALRQIDVGNVGSLVEEFSVPTETEGGHQGQPLAIGGVLYVVTPFPNRLIAIDGASGEILWRYAPTVDQYAQGVACCDVVNRGAAFGRGMVVFNTLDATTVAVDARTGRETWRTTLGDPYVGETLTGAPLIVDDTVIVGSSGAELGLRGWTAGLDLKTGKLNWRAFGTGPDAEVGIGAGFRPFYAKDRGENLGATTWPGELWKNGGAATWAGLTYDPDLKLLYHGTANPGVWNPTMRLGDKSNPDPRRSDNKWGSTIFARDPATGAAKWAYQVTPHDAWDFDATSENIAVELIVGAKRRKVVVHFDKNGFAYTIDRRTGEVLIAEKFGGANWASRVDLESGLPKLVEDKQPREGARTRDICPSPFGVKNWPPAAFSPKTKLFYVPTINLCYDLLPLKAVYVAGAPFIGADVDIKPGRGDAEKPRLGALVAWDAATGREAWAVREDLPAYSGVLATAGGVVFYGTLDKRFKALDAETGKTLLDVALECGVIGNPMTYLGADGRQRVAVYSGLGWLAGGFAGGPCATQPAGAAAPGGRLHVFKLPERGRP